MVLSHRFTDIDRLTEQIQSFSKVQFTQLSVESLRFDLLLVAFPEVQFLFAKTSCPILILGEKPRDAFIFTCLMETAGPCIISHSRKVSHQTLLGFDPDLEAKAVLPASMQYVAVQNELPRRKRTGYQNQKRASCSSLCNWR